MTIHPFADVKSTHIGPETLIWQYVVILEKAQIGRKCTICSHVFIESDVVIGDNVTIKNGVQLWDGIRIEDNVFVGPNATFTNDSVPRSKCYPAGFDSIHIGEGASIGANATIIGPRRIGCFALIGAGAVVNRDVGDYWVVVGNPARQIGYITEGKNILDMQLRDKEDGTQYALIKGRLETIKV